MEHEVLLSPVKCFNQQLLNFMQTFAADSDYIFFARSIVEQCRLKSSTNIALQKIRCSELTASSIKRNYKESIKQLLANDNAFSFMSSVKGTPAYWKQFFLEVLAMVKQLGVPTYFLTLSCADLRWDKLPYLVNKVNNLGLTEEELRNLSYQAQATL